MKFLWSICYVFVLLFSWNVDVNATNTDIGSANSITFGTSYSDSITSSVTSRFYKLELPSSGNISIVLDGDIDGLCIRLYNVSAEKVASDYLSRSDVTNQLNYRQSYNLTGGIYYLECYTGSYSGSYQFNVDFISANESFAETGNGNNNDIHSANEVLFGNFYNGQIAYTDEIDYYAVTLTASGKLNLILSGDIDSIAVYIYDQEGKKLSYEFISRSEVTNKAECNYLYNLKPGIYYLAFRNSSYTGNYQFKCDFFSANESFVETGKDDYLSGANPIAFGTSYNGQISVLCNDTVDFYVFTVPKASTYQLVLTAEFLGSVYIYNGSGESLWSGYTSLNKSSGMYELVDTFSISAGTYYLRVKTVKEPGNYSFKLNSTTTAIGKVTLSSVKSTKKKTAVVEWKSVSGADGYQIQYAKSKSFKGKKTATVSSGVTKKTIKKLSGKKRYYVRVRAYEVVNGSRKYGNWSSVKSVKVK